MYRWPIFNGLFPWLLLLSVLYFRTETEAFCGVNCGPYPFSTTVGISDGSRNGRWSTSRKISPEKWLIPQSSVEGKPFTVNESFQRLLPTRHGSSMSILHRRRISRMILRASISFVILTAVFSLLSRSAHAASQMVTSAESSPLAARAIETASVATSSVVTSNPPHLSLATQVRLSLRLVAAGAMGGAIGKERSERYRQADKIMGMVAVGAAMFSICSVIGFSGTHYDASRMASTVASGVGFIGAGVIYHEPYNAEKSEMPQASGDEPKSDMVHGLTTAAAIFMSAAIGVSCGVGLYILSGVSTLATLAILRIGGNVKYRSYERRRLESIRREKALLIQERLKSLRDFEQLKRMEHLWREQQSHLMDELGSGAVRQELSGNQTRAGIEKTMVESRDFGRRSRGKDTT